MKDRSHSFIRTLPNALQDIIYGVARGSTIAKFPQWPTVDVEPFGDKLYVDMGGEPEGYMWMCDACGCALSTDKDPPQNRAQAVERIEHAPSCIVRIAWELIQ